MNNFFLQSFGGKARSKSLFRSVWDFSLSLVYGASECLACGKTSYAVPVCAECFARLKDYVELRSERRCAKCGKELVSEMGLCLECRENPALSSLDALYPLHSYRLWKKDLVFAWKMEGQRRLSPLLANLLFKALCDLGFQRMPIVPVPPRPGKVKKEGWDQIAELSSLLSKENGIQILELLERKSGLEQKKLSKEERLGATGAVYSLLPAVKEGILLPPKEAVILDDVVTTGATMEKCAWLLKSAGVEHVYGLALFRVD